MEDQSYIYLLQDGNDRGTQIYKIGRTTQCGGDTRRLKRIQSYAKNTIVYALVNVQTNQVVEIEKEIKRIFKQKYLLVRGLEWFQGDVKDMKHDIYSITSTPCTLQSNADDNIHSSTVIEKTPRFKCNKCYKDFARMENLRRHSFRCKTISTPLECNKCHQVYSSRQSLSNHKKICINGEESSESLLI